MTPDCGGAPQVAASSCQARTLMSLANESGAAGAAPNTTLKLAGTLPLVRVIGVVVVSVVDVYAVASAAKPV